MMSMDVEAIKEDLDELKREVRDSISGMRSDIKELAKALHELIRLDGDLSRVADITNRIGKQVDDLFRLLRTETNALDQRLRTVENKLAGNGKSVDLFDALVKHALTLLFGLAIGGGVVMLKMAG